MTLILSLATDKHIVQVSDRRLTVGNGSNRGKLVDDDTNKATLYCDRMCFSYTGLASINNIDTDKWVVNQLSNLRKNSYADACELIRNSATHAFKNITNRKIKRHSFACAGWARVPPDGRIVPAITTISNALENLQWLNNAKPQFECVHYGLTNGKDFIVVSTGQRVPSKILNKLNRNIAKSIRKDAGPFSLGRLLAGAIWDVSQVNRTVGRNLQLISIPKESIYSSGGLALSKPRDDVATFLYLSPTRADGVLFGPNAVDASGITFSGLVLKPLDKN